MQYQLFISTVRGDEFPLTTANKSYNTALNQHNVIYVRTINIIHSIHSEYIVVSGNTY